MNMLIELMPANEMLKMKSVHGARYFACLPEKIDLASDNEWSRYFGRNIYIVALRRQPVFRLNYLGNFAVFNRYNK